MKTSVLIARIGIALVTLMMAVAVTLFTNSLVLARSDPDRALAFWPTDAARVATASVLLAGELSPARARQAARLSLQTLARSPVNAEAARDLGTSYAVLGDTARARTILLQSEALSRRDLPTQMWLIEDRVQAGDINGALAHYDRALRTSEASRPGLLPVLAQAANDPAIARSLSRYLASRPEWWADFVAQFVVVGTNPAAFRILADGLRFDPVVEEDRGRLSTLLDRLVSIRAYGTARALFGRATGNWEMLVDGGFEHDHGLAPFDWQLVNDTDRSATREPRESAAGNALSIQGTEGKEVARQLVILSSGTYLLRVRSGAVASGTRSPPAITLNCVNDGTEIASVPLPVGAAARDWTAAFNVPAGCTAQWLGIVSAANVGYLAESAWVDDLAIRRTAGN